MPIVSLSYTELDYLSESGSDVASFVQPFLVLFFTRKKTSESNRFLLRICIASSGLPIFMLNLSFMAFYLSLQLSVLLVPLQYLLKGRN